MSELDYVRDAKLVCIAQTRNHRIHMIVMKQAEDRAKAAEKREQAVFLV